MRNFADMADWPKPHAGSWFDPSDPDVGTADRGSNFLWDVRVRLQVRVRDGVVVEARCHVEDQDSAGLEDVIAASIARHLEGKTLASAADFSRPIPPSLRKSWSREEAVRTGEFGPASRPADLMWSVSFAEDATLAALADLALKSVRRSPPPPVQERQSPPPLLKRLLRRIPFLRGFGL